MRHMSSTDWVGFVLGGTPPNWSQGSWHGHWAKVYRAKQGWLDRSVTIGKQARLNADWLVCDKHQRRIVEIRCFRIRLMDFDGAASSVKPILDGLKASRMVRDKKLNRMVLVPGAGLVYDDAPEYVELVSPGNLQVRVAHRSEVHTQVVVRRS